MSYICGALATVPQDNRRAFIHRAGRAMQDMEFQLHAPYFAFDPRGQRVQQQLIDDKIIES